ncbi:hypothetical protein DVR12_19475 [Chitinophaga silvatica]|uniref:Glycosyltransferase RgtA/B/C/D-like domain-containing protein n=1 Tax=Chitinophaga silvatica TaxID=2282649 RepID=A0A3E1Y740_9BACT|nr:hypothetical protein [Chitinophaga silvatica]RFS20739.1 hypothetical protein DVR12_19475 [Chitinophaga silvatica]
MELKNSNSFSIKKIFFQTRESRNYFAVTTLVSIVGFVVFKYFFSFPNFIHGDSFVYIAMARNNVEVETYPIGYPMFLRFFSVFSKSDYLLVTIQFLLLQFSTLYFVFSIFCLFNLARVAKIILLIFVVCNPINLFLSNYISTDTFFLSFSLIWFTQVLWLMRVTSFKLLTINILLLAFLFMIRYNALYYPLVTLFSIIISRKNIISRLIGLGISCLFIFCYIKYTSKGFEKITGVNQFSPFSGWQLANNALYAYRYVDSSDLKKLPIRYKKIDKIVREYFDTTRDVKKYPVETLKASTVYMWDPSSPLNLYMNKIFKDDSTSKPLQKWAFVAPMMKDYGSVLIKAYPKEFFIYYILPNSLKYYNPPLEFLAEYNGGKDSISIVAKDWFDYKDPLVHNRIKRPDFSFLRFYSLIVASMNVMLLLNIASYFLLGIYRRFKDSKSFVLLIILIWAVNMAFSIFASSIALRFQLFPIILDFSLALVLTDYLVRMAFYSKPEVDNISLIELE